MKQYRCGLAFDSQSFAEEDAECQYIEGFARSALSQSTHGEGVLFNIARVLVVIAGYLDVVRKIQPIVIDMVEV